jgi:8-oxo-dGTP pyrophosphatase MutT (NUDIX family)
MNTAARERFRLVSAVHLFFTRDGEILLQRRCNTGYEDGNYSVPAGHLDGGESVIHAAIREAREEVGVEVPLDAIRAVGVMHRKAGDERIDFFVEVSKWKGEIINSEPRKCDRLDWFRVSALPTNTVPYIRRALQNYTSGTWFDCYGWDDAATE